MALQLQAVVALNTAAFTGGLGGMTASLNKFAGMAMTMFGGVAGQVAAMWAAFGPMGGVAAGLQAVVKVGASFEQEMKKVSSYSGITGDDLARLGERGMKAAKELGFSAKDAGTALADLALSGISTSDDLMNTLVPALRLAGATGGTATQTAETLTATLKVFQLETKEAAAVADLFAGAIASSPLNMERLADAMKYAGPAGSAFNMTLKETVDTVAAFHAVGLRGQMAGTSFRMALIKLSAAASSGAGEVGGAMKGWAANTEGLRGAVERLTAAGIPAGTVIQELGARAGPGVAALMKLGAAGMDEYSEKITKNSDVVKMYNTQMSALMGQFKLFKAAVEEVAQKLFIALKPAFEKILTGAKNCLTAISDLGAKFKWMAGPITQLLPLLVGTGGLIWAFGKIVAITPGLGGSLAAMWTAAAANARIAAAQMAAIGTTTLPMVATSSAALAKAMHAGANGFFALKTAAYGSVHQMELMTGAVAKGLTPAQARAVIATNQHTTAIAGLSRAVWVAAAAFAGWKLGGWIREIKIGDATLGNFFDTMMNFALGVGAVEGAWKDEIAAVQQRVKEQKIAEDQAKKLADATEEKRKKAVEAMMAEARAADIAREAMMEKMRAEKRAADSLAAIEAAHLNAAWAQGTMQQATIASAEAQERLVTANHELIAAETEFQAAINDRLAAYAEVAAAEKAVNEAERAAIDAKRNLTAAQSDYADALESAGDDSDKATDFLQVQTEAEVAAAAATAKLEEVKMALTTANDKLADAVANVADKERGLTAAFNESTASVDAAITEYNTLRFLVEDAGIEFQDATNLMQQFGSRSAEVVDRVNRLGITMEQAGRDVEFLSRHAEMCADILKTKYGNALGDTMKFTQRWGEHAMKVAAYMAKNGVTAEQAAKDLNIYSQAVKKAAEDTQPAIEALARYGDEAIRLGRALSSMNKDKLDAIYSALLDFAEKLSKLPPITLTWARDLGQLNLPPLGNVGFWKGKFLELADALEQANTLDLDMSWADDLGKLNLPPLGNVGFWKSNFEKLVEVLLPANALDLDFSWAEDLRELRLPRIGNVESFKTDFDKLLAVFANVPAIDLTWMDSLTNFVLPETAFWMPLATTFSEFAEKLDKAAKPDLSWLANLSIIDTVDVEKLRMIVDVLSGLAGKAYNASILIGWKDNETLASIDGHLATICAAKGIIWG